MAPRLKLAAKAIGRVPMACGDRFEDRGTLPGVPWRQGALCSRKCAKLQQARPCSFGKAALKDRSPSKLTQPSAGHDQCCTYRNSRKSGITIRL